MKFDKRVTTLVVLAVVLASLAIVLNVNNHVIPLTKPAESNSNNGGVIGVNIQPTPVEDKLVKNNSGVQS